MALSKKLQQQAKNYKNLNKGARLRFLQDAYIKDENSFGIIADAVGTYANLIRRHAKALGIKSRTKSQAQSLSLKNDVAKHPTKGKKRSEATKEKISEKRAASWKNMSDEQRKHISLKRNFHLGVKDILFWGKI